MQIVSSNNDEAEVATVAEVRIISESLLAMGNGEVLFYYIQEPTLAATQKSCCAPRQWEGEAISFNELGELKHRLFYDADKMYD